MKANVISDLVGICRPYRLILVQPYELLSQMAKWGNCDPQRCKQRYRKSCNDQYIAV